MTINQPLVPESSNVDLLTRTKATKGKVSTHMHYSFGLLHSNLLYSGQDGQTEKQDRIAVRND